MHSNRIETYHAEAGQIYPFVHSSRICSYSPAASEAFGLQVGDQEEEGQQQQDCSLRFEGCVCVLVMLARQSPSRGYD